MDNCSSCLALKSMGGDAMNNPTYCRACYQREREKNEQFQADYERLRKGIKAVCDLINNTGRVNKWKIFNWLEQALKK